MDDVDCMACIANQAIMACIANQAIMACIANQAITPFQPFNRGTVLATQTRIRHAMVTLSIFGSLYRLCDLWWDEIMQYWRVRPDL